MVARADRRLALDGSTCVEILRKCGFLPSRCLSVVNLCEIPDGLNVAETERFLRENAAAICGAQNHGGPAGAGGHAAPLQTS